MENIQKIELTEERLESYVKYGFTEQALNDPHWVIRLEAYKALGFTEKLVLSVRIIVVFRRIGKGSPLLVGNNATQYNQKI